jgi:hypothetical protein
MALKNAMFLSLYHPFPSEYSPISPLPCVTKLPSSFFLLTDFSCFLLAYSDQASMPISPQRLPCQGQQEGNLPVGKSNAHFTGFILLDLPSAYKTADHSLLFTFSHFVSGKLFSLDFPPLMLNKVILLQQLSSPFT